MKTLAHVAWLLVLDYQAQLLAHFGIELCELRDEFHCLTLVTARQVHEHAMLGVGLYARRMRLQKQERKYPEE